MCSCPKVELGTLNASLAQRLEQATLNGQVEGSNPSRGANYEDKIVGSHIYNQDQDTKTAKERLKGLWWGFMDSGIPTVAFYVGFFALIIWKPILLLWMLAAVGAYAIITILGANFTGG